MSPHDFLHFAEIATNGIHLHVAQAGPADGPLVLLLHGFPEYWYGWRSQIPALAQAGLRVWAPDQRGYNLSDKPRQVRDYRLDTLAADVAGLIEAAGVEQADVVGHDWGGAVAWQVAMDFPERVNRLAVLNCPHPWVMRRHLLRSPRQMLRSSYILGFQIPWLPEKIAQMGNWRLMVRALTRSSRPGTFSEADFDEYRRAWSQPGAFRSMLNWYRALVRHPPRDSSEKHIHVPALLIWGERDKFLGKEMAQPSIDLCDDGRLVVFDEATHWVQHEESLRVNDLLINFLCEDGPRNLDCLGVIR
jgi:pimeloyl-ACP methyl ester carboxylesterase